MSADAAPPRRPERVALFIDYQNAYMRAREAFHALAEIAHTAGQFNPLELGNLIVSKGGPHRELAAVYIYRGMPDATRDPKGYGACRRQLNAWNALDDRVKVYARPLRYPPVGSHEPPREKGVDVALAVDFVMKLAAGDYDTGVLFSADTDLKPALEAVFNLQGSPYPRCEVACWSPKGAHARRLRVPGRALWCHFLDEEDYRFAADFTDYNVASH